MDNLYNVLGIHDLHCLQRSVAFGQDIAIGEAFAKWIEKYKEKQRFRFSNTEIVLEPIS